MTPPEYPSLIAPTSTTMRMWLNEDESMNRRSGLALSMLVMSLWMGQTALTESGLFSVAWGVASITLTCLSGVILAGVYVPEAIPDEELSPLASRILVAMLLIGVIVSLLLFFPQV